MTTAAERYQEAKERVTKARETMKETAKAAFSEASSELFAKHPKLESFSWTQYTPYFNDGDTCEFSVHKENINVVFDGEEHEDIGKWHFEYHRKKGDAVNEELASAVSDANDFLATFDEDSYREMFEDHVKVTVSRDGVEVESYDHD